MFNFLRFPTLLNAIERNNSAVIAELSCVNERLDEIYYLLESVQSGRATEPEITEAKKTCVKCKESVTKSEETIVQTTPTAKSPKTPAPAGTNPELETVTTPSSPEELKAENAPNVGLPGTVAIDVANNGASEAMPTRELVEVR